MVFCGSHEKVLRKVECSVEEKQQHSGSEDNKRQNGFSVFPKVRAIDNSCRNAFYDWLKKLGLDSSRFGLHLAKIGGVVHLRNSGVSWRSIND